MVGRYPGSESTTSSSVGQYQVMVDCSTSLGTSSSTGPGRPVVAMWKAWRTAMGMSAGCMINSLCLVTLRVMPTVSHSWNASVPIAVVETWPVMQTIGIESMNASHSGVTILVAAGPLVTMATPGRPVTWA